MNKTDERLAAITIIALMLSVVFFLMGMATGAFLFEVLGFITGLGFLLGILHGIRIK